MIAAETTLTTLTATEDQKFMGPFSRNMTPPPHAPQIAPVLILRLTLYASQTANPAKKLIMIRRSKTFIMLGTRAVIGRPPLLYICLA